MTLLLCAMIGVTVIQPSFSSALGTGPANIVDLLKTNDYKAETVQVFDGGKLCKVLAGDNAVYNVIFYNDGSTELYDPVKHEKIFQKDKISPALKSKIEKAKDDEKIPVSIWIKDIDYNKVNSFVKDKINIDAADIEKDNLKLDKMQEYIETKRSKAKDEYNNNNSRFVKRALASDTILFTSKYAPLVIAELNKKEIEMLRNSDDVFDMDFFVNECNSTDETAFSIPNINANYTRDTLGLKGSGVKIGQIESGYPNKTNAQLSDRSITFDVPDNQANITDHATEVSSIIVGKTNGLVPNAALYVASNYTSTTNFYEKIEWLITQGVNVINMSNTTGGTAGAYTSIAKWIDHLAIQHSVHFVKSAGNSGPSGGITEPGMAYNIMTVGSINDHDSPNEP